MSDLPREEQFWQWHLRWKERVCDVIQPFAHGTVCRSARYPDFWEYNCVRLEHALEAEAMIATADRELADCPHRFVEWLIPMPDRVAEELRSRGWLANPLVYLLHDGRRPPQSDREIVEVDYDAVNELRDVWHHEDFGEHGETDEFRAQAREVAERADVHVLAGIVDRRPVGFAQVETHDGASEVAQVFVHADARGAGWGTALTAEAIILASALAPRVWICAERDNRPRRLYERLGFAAVVETGAAILTPR